ITGVGTLNGLAVSGATTLTSNAAAAVPLSVVGAVGQTGDLLDVTANGGAAGSVFNIAANGNITASGSLTGLTGLTSSGTVTFSGLSTVGVVHSSAAGVLSTSLITNADLAGGFYSAITGVGTLTGLTVNGAEQFANLGAGVAHLDASGNLSSSQVTGSDIANSTITNTNPAAGSFSNITGVGTLHGLAVSGATTLTSNAAAAVPLSVVGAVGQTGDLLDVTANGGAAGGVFNIAANGNITASGSLTGLTGLTSSGTVTFSGLSTVGVVHSSAAGVLSTSLITNADLAGGFYSAITGVGTLTGLTVNGAEQFANLGAGVAHLDASGNLSSSQVTGSDIANSTITNTNLAAGSFSNITGVGTLTGLTVNGAEQFANLGAGV